MNTSPESPALRPCRPLRGIALVTAVALTVLGLTATESVAQASPVRSVTSAVQTSPRQSPASAATQRVVTQSKKAQSNKAAKKLAKKLKKSRAKVLAVAKQQPNYTGHVVAKKGRALRLYGVSKPSPAMKKAMRQARRQSGLNVTWRSDAFYTRAELRAAAKVVRTDRRVTKVYVRPTDGGCLAVRVKRSATFPKWISGAELGRELGVVVEVYLIADAVAT